MRALAALLLAVAVLLCARGAVAETGAEVEARALFKDGNRLLEGGDYVGALERYHSAYEKLPSVKILLNIGTALRQLGRYGEAADTYERYMNDPTTDVAKRTEVAKILLELDEKLAMLSFEGDLPGGRLLVDDKAYSDVKSGLSVRVAPGPHMVSAERPGFTSVTVTVNLLPGQHLLVPLKLARAPVPAAAATVTPPRHEAPPEPAARAPAVGVASAPAAAAPAPAASSPVYKRWWLWTIVAVVVVGAGVGVGVAAGGGSHGPDVSKDNAGSYQVSF